STSPGGTKNWRKVRRRENYFLPLCTRSELFGSLHLGDLLENPSPVEPLLKLHSSVKEAQTASSAAKGLLNLGYFLLRKAINSHNPDLSPSKEVNLIVEVSKGLGENSLELG
ncbi:MAG: hypothetical protein QXU91_06775, partial [Thermofilum sp.]